MAALKLLTSASSLVCLLVIALAATPSGAAEIIYAENLQYGQVDEVKLLADVAYPKSDKAVPAIVSVHGGRWLVGHKRDGSTIKVKQWAGFGFFAMSIEYRLVKQSPAPACYQDLQCAIRWVHAHAKQYNIDTQQIFLIGQSAGGHLVSLAATLGDGPWPRTGGWEKQKNDFRAAVSVSAAYDIVLLDWGIIWKPAGQDQGRARQLASPTEHVSKTMKPLLVMHSDNDHSVPIGNALMMVERLEKTGAPHRFHRYPKMGHMGINQEVIDKSLVFIREQSKQTGADRD